MRPRTIAVIAIVTSITAAGLGVGGPRVSAGINLLDNGGFESWPGGPQSWTSSPGTSVAQSFNSRSGASAIGFTHNLQSPQEVWQTVDAVPSATYDAEAFCIVAGPNVVSAALQLTWLTANGGTIAAVTAQFPLGSPSYQRSALNGVQSPAAAARIRTSLVSRTNGSPGGIICDDVTLTPTLTSTPSPSTTAAPTATPAAASATADPTSVPASPTPGATMTATATTPPNQTASATATPTATASAAPATATAASAAQAGGASNTGGGGVAPAPAPAGTPSATPVAPGSVVISEVLFNAPAAGRDAAFEWFEIENQTGTAVDLQGWSIGDNNKTKPLPPLVVPANGLAVVAASAQAVAAVPDGVPLAVMPDGSIGNGLANSGDRLRLFDATGHPVDGLSWGTDRTVNDPPCPAVPAGHPLQRFAGSLSGCRYQDNPSPSPGYRSSLAPPSGSPTGTPLPVPSAIATMVPVATPATEVVGGPETTLEVGPSGGEIGVGGGSSQRGGAGLVLPLGALSAATKVTVKRVVGAPAGIGAPSGGAFVGRGLEITADPPALLRHAAWINVSLTEAELDGRNLRRIQGGVVAVAAGRVQPLVTRIVDFQRGVVQVLVEHFSSFALYYQPEPGPLLLAPSDGVTLNVLGTTLVWDQPAEATQYQLQLAPFAGDGPGINLIRAIESSYVVAVPDFGETEPNYVMLPDMAYTWRVRTTASNKTGRDLLEADWGGWSIATFRTPAVAADSIVRVAPEENVVVEGTTPALTWANLNKAVFYYEVQVSGDPSFGAQAFLYWELRHGGVTSPPNSYRIPAAFPLEPGRQYYWRVRPRVQGDGSEISWSLPFTFRTG